MKIRLSELRSIIRETLVEARGDADFDYVLVLASDGTVWRTSTDEIKGLSDEEIVEKVSQLPYKENLGKGSSYVADLKAMGKTHATQTEIALWQQKNNPQPQKYHGPAYADEEPGYVSTMRGQKPARNYWEKFRY